MGVTAEQRQHWCTGAVEQHPQRFDVAAHKPVEAAAIGAERMLVHEEERWHTGRAFQSTAQERQHLRCHLAMLLAGHRHVEPDQADAADRLDDMQRSFARPGRIPERHPHLLAPVGIAGHGEHRTTDGPEGFAYGRIALVVRLVGKVARDDHCIGSHRREVRERAA
jgi:hypothetical protein